MLPKFIALLGLFAGAAGLLFFAALPAGAQVTTTDYDANDNGLIDVSTLAQLNAMRWDLDGDGDPVSASASDYLTAFPNRETGAAGRMGCPSGTCTGYELMANLTFPTSGTFSSWTPIGTSTAPFNTTFDGNGHTLTRLTVSVSSGDAGLFGSTRGVIRDLGIINPNVTITASSQEAGALAGNIASGGRVDSSYVMGGSVTLAANNNTGGGLTGRNYGNIRASYSTATVRTDGSRDGSLVGGLAGWNDGGTIIASYAAGIVSASGPGAIVGGFVGPSGGATAVITNSYCDTQVSGQSNCIGAQSGATVTVDGKTTSQLQTPVGYTGIYADWDIDLTGDSTGDDPWYFGTSSQYPAPSYLRRTDYDSNNNGLIEVSSLAQLNAMRWDLDGDGDPAAASLSNYNAAFPNRETGAAGRMGCPATCGGYELTANLTFPASGTFSSWTPIGTVAAPFTTTFDGGGHTLTGLTVNVGSGNAGLFGELGSSGIIKDTGIINPNVRITSLGRAGALVGNIQSGGRVDSSYVQGGSVTIASNSAEGGGLAGANRGTIRASYSRAAVSIDGSRNNVLVGGLVGITSDTIIASYAAGSVSATGTAVQVGGLVGRSSGSGSAITASYCDTQASGQTACVGEQFGGSSVTVAGKTTSELQAPTGYTSIYADWNISLDAGSTGDYPWNFGTDSQYPVLNTPAQRIAAAPRPPPPPAPPRAPEPDDDHYDPATAHPEIYVNERHGMSATCQVQEGADGEPESALISFDLGSYQKVVVLHLSLWNGEVFISYEWFNLDEPSLERDGQTAQVRVTTDPASTRFRLDSVFPTTNLVLGYADCHTDDDPGG